MIEAFFQGIIPGLILSAAIGPVFFMLIQTSIQRGFKLAMVMEFGIISSDTFCILCAYFGLAAFFQNPDYKNLIFSVGSLVLIIFGVVMFLSHKKVKSKKELLMKYASIRRRQKTLKIQDMEMLLD